MLSTITTKGQVTIPKPLRDLFSINPHDKIDFSVEDDRIILRPIRTLRDLRGCIQCGGEPDAERSTAKKTVGQRVMDEMQ